MADHSSQSADAPPSAKKRGNGRRKWYLLGLALIFIAVGVAYALYYVLVGQYYATTKDAYVEGNRVRLTPQIAGTVIAIQAEDTDIVHAGDTMIELDDTDVSNRLAQASATLARTVRDVHQLFAQAAEQRATVTLHETQLKQAQRDYARDRRLVKAHGVTTKAFEHSRSTYHQAQSQLKAARQRLAELNAQTDDTTLRRHPRVQQAEAKLRAAYLDVRRTRVPAPVSGYVAQRDVQLGQKVNPSKPMLSIVPLDDVWVDANFKETAVKSMRLGQDATLTADFYGDDIIYQGHVAGISAGTGAAFELLPPQNATGNWIKIVRRVPVRIALDHDELDKHPLRIGLSMQVSVDLHDTGGRTLAKAPPAKPRFSTDVYKQRRQGAQNLIDQIVNANDGDPDTAPNDRPARIGQLSTHS